MDFLAHAVNECYSFKEISLLLIVDDLLDFNVNELARTQDAGTCYWVVPYYAIHSKDGVYCFNQGYRIIQKMVIPIETITVAKPEFIWVGFLPKRNAANNLQLTLENSSYRIVQYCTRDELYLIKNVIPVKQFQNNTTFDTLNDLKPYRILVLIERLFPVTIHIITEKSMLQLEQESAIGDALSEVIKSAVLNSIDCTALQDMPNSYKRVFVLSVSLKMDLFTNDLQPEIIGIQPIYSLTKIGYENFSKLLSLLSKRVECSTKIALPKIPGCIRSTLVSEEGNITTSLRHIHPHAWLHPLVDRRFCMTKTKKWPEARFAYIEKDLQKNGTSNEQLLLEFLGRVISDEPADNPEDVRFVEPGVGRTYLVNGLSIKEHGCFKDFSVLGVGLTPYSSKGYAMVGPYVDGLTSLKRAQHRHRCSVRLEEAGCRVAKTAAIIELPGLSTTMPDYSLEPAAILVRGFRTIFRVKQLDPLACLYLSIQHRPFIQNFIADERWSPEEKLGQTERDVYRYAGLKFGATTNSLRDIIGSLSVQPGTGETTELKSYKARRRNIIQAYAPILINHAKERLSVELNRDPVREKLNDEYYVKWFCYNLGYQLGIMRNLKFLHDYHHQGVSRTSNSWIYTLCETNVSLLAEFPDLDTGIFVDKEDDEVLDTLRITSTEFRNLQSNYEQFHLTDIKEAENVALTLAQIVYHAELDKINEALYKFSLGYLDGSKKVV